MSKRKRTGDAANEDQNVINEGVEHTLCQILSHMNNQLRKIDQRHLADIEQMRDDFQALRESCANRHDESNRHSMSAAPSSSIEPPSPRRLTRRRLTRRECRTSLSEPPVPLACSWHGNGNANRDQIMNVRLADFEHITDPNSAAFHNWNSHIDAVVFSDKLDWSMRIMEGMRKAMLREYGDIHVCRSGSRNNRSFMFKCKTCQEAVCVQYGKSCTSADIQTQILQVFDFLRLERPQGVPIAWTAVT